MGNRNPSRVIIDGDTVTVISTQGDHFIVDRCDAELVIGFCWQTNRKGHLVYAHRRFRDGDKIKSEYLHRRIMDVPSGVFVDHIDGNTQNNRRCNLRKCSPAENAANKGVEYTGRSGKIGVYVERGRYRAKICINGKRVHLGSFDTVEEAEVAYLNARNINRTFFRAA